MMAAKLKSTSKDSAEIPIVAADGQYLSALHPKYLHTNSTSHTWPFSAVAELIDNAYDPDVNASQLFIDVKESNGEKLLILTDNGSGMMPDKLYKMVSFGFSEKIAIGDHHPVGQYGNGFKSGSMRLGKDALVFTKTETRWSLAFLSQTYLEKINSSTIIVPMVTWDPKKFSLIENGGQKSLIQILQHSVVSSLLEIKEEFKNINGTTGTRIIISKLRKRSSGNKYELDFLTDSYDIRIPDDSADTDESRYKREQRQDHIPASDYSLRAYCSILYLKPRMQIILCGKKVKTLIIAKSLAKTEVDTYTPSGYSKPVKVTFGFSQNKNHYGIMMYNRNRLIKPYVRVGYQLKPNSLGVGVIGVIECDFLQPTHNKQDFDQSKVFRACMAGLGRKLNEYWQEKKGGNKAATTNQQQIVEETEMLLPDKKWVQCDNKNCLKWRILPDDTDLDALPDKWYCKDHPLPEWRSCDIPEKLEDEEEVVTPYKKEVSKQLKKEQQQKKKLAERRANDLQQMVETKEKELEEEKRKRTQNEAKAKAHEAEIRRLKMQLEKTSNSPSNTQTPAKPNNSAEASTKQAVVTKQTVTGSPNQNKMNSSSKTTTTTTTTTTTIVLVPSTALKITQSTLASSPSPSTKVSQVTGSTSPIAVTRSTRQSINLAMKQRLPFTTRRVPQVTGTTQVTPTNNSTTVSTLPKSTSASNVSTVASPQTPVMPKLQATRGSAAILPKSLPSTPTQVISLTAKGPVTVASTISGVTAGSPRVYRVLLTDPKLSDSLNKIKPNVSALAIRSTTPINVVKSTSIVTQAQPRLTLQTSTSKDIVNSNIKNEPSSIDINQQLAQIGIDAIAAQAQDMVPSMAITTTASTRQSALAVDKQVTTHNSNIGLTNGKSTVSSNTSANVTIGSKRRMDEEEKGSDDDIEIIEMPSTKKLKAPDVSGENLLNNKEIVSKEEVECGKEKKMKMSASSEIEKKADKDIMDDVQKLSSDKLRNILVQRSQQLRDLRKSICQLLGLLVPEINLPRSETMPLDDDTIDVLLRDVLASNKESKNA